MVSIGSLCSTAILENIKIVDKKEIPLKGKFVDVNCNWFDFKLLKCLGSATESGIVKFCYPLNDKPMVLVRDENPIIQKDFGGSTVKLEIPFDSK